jgi:hypothetical protein
MGYVYYYNNVREHSALGYRTPFQALNEQLPQLGDDARCPPPFILEEVSTDIGPWSGYNLLAHHLHAGVSRVFAWLTGVPTVRSTP